MFDIGSQIVCIDDSNFPHHLIPQWYSAFPVKGKTYVVRDIVPAAGNWNHWNKKDANTCAVLLQGIRNTLSKHGVECGYKPERFRELEEEIQTQELEEPIELVTK